MHRRNPWLVALLTPLTMLAACDNSSTEPDEPPELYMIGGSVTGMVGSGLVIRFGSLRVTMDNDGSFTFPGSFPTGMAYLVQIETQPSKPDQPCTLTGGTGQIPGADVTGIQVTCDPPTLHESLDAGFGDHGKATTGLPAGATRIALQTDGRIVAVGATTLARYLASGAPDPGFGTDGLVTVRLNLMQDELTGLAIQPDGKIVVGGRGRTDVNSPTDFDIGVARFNADGTPDVTFGTAGMVTIDFFGRGESVADIMIQSDGKIVVTGSAAHAPSGLLDADFAVLRLMATGQVDSTFGQDGKVMTNIAGQTDLAAAALLQQDGKIVVGGRVATSGGASPDMAVVRYNADGSLDAGFGTGGIVRFQTSGVWEEVRGLARQPDGKLVLVGNQNIQSQGSPHTFMVVRLEASGALDATFGTNGVMTDIPFGNQNSIGEAVVIQGDGRIIVAGMAVVSQSADMAIARLNTNGTLDTSFGTGGLITQDFFGDADEAKAMVVDPQGAAIVAGGARNGSATGIGMVRVSP